MESRRSFIKKSTMAGLTAVSLPHSRSLAHNLFRQNDDQVSPSQVQKKWMDYGFGMFIHFGINTYYDKEWSDGTLDPSAFNPTQLDTDQWCKTARDAGMKYVVMVTKHHDGFCLWPSQYTDYSVKSTPYKGDVVAKLVNSAAKYGLDVGFYYSLWDQHEKSHDENEWVYVTDFMKGQLEELLTEYGDVVELWFDGFWKKQKHGWTKKGSMPEDERNEKFIEAWRMEGAYWWQMDHIYQFIKSLQPACLVMNNSTTSYPGVPLHPVDIRSGEKYTEVAEDQKIWEWLGKKIYLPLQIETTMSAKGNEKFPSGNWFWHSWDHSVKSKEEIRRYLDVAGKMDANLLLNVGPSDKGKLREVDIQVLTSL